MKKTLAFLLVTICLVNITGCENRTDDLTEIVSEIKEDNDSIKDLLTEEKFTVDLNDNNLRQLYFQENTEEENEINTKYVVYIKTDDTLTYKYRMGTQSITCDSNNINIITLRVTKKDNITYYDIDSTEYTEEINGYTVKWKRTDSDTESIITTVIELDDEYVLTSQIELFNSNCTATIIEKKYDVDYITNEIVIDEIKNIYSHIVGIEKTSDKTVYTEESQTSTFVEYFDNE